MSTQPELRNELAAKQAALVRTLMSGGDMPPDFDTRLLQAAAVSLARKRARSVARCWPDLSRSLGERFSELFASYAKTTVLPRQGGPLADGRGFAYWLAARNELTEAGQREALGVDIRYRPIGCGMGSGLFFAAVNRLNQPITYLRRKKESRPSRPLHTTGLTLRNWPTLKMAWLRPSRRLAVAMWLPGLGPFWFRLSMPSVIARNLP
jgi:hypothetical protein